MKRLAGMFAVCASLALAETWNGTLVDVMCKNQDLANHATKCAITCSKSGYGLVLADGRRRARRRSHSWARLRSAAARIRMSCPTRAGRYGYR